MNIVIAGGYDTRNLGDHMALWGLQKALPDARFNVLMRHPADPLPIDCGRTLNLDHQTRDESEGRIFYGFNDASEPRERLGAIREAIHDADCLMIGGGRMFVDICFDFMRGPIPYFVELVKLAKWVGTPVWLVNNTYVDVERPLAKRMVDFCRANAVLDFARDSELTPDTAYAWSEFSAGSGRREGVLGICARHADDAAWLVRVMRRLINQINPRRVYWIPMQTYCVDSDVPDDRVQAKLLDVYLGSGGAHVDAFDNLEALARFVHECDYLISARRHGVVMGACQGVRTIGISMEPNTSAVCEQLGLADVYPDIPEEPFPLAGFEGQMRARELWEKSKLAYRAGAEVVMG